MIKAYLAVISNVYEGEDIQVQYCIYKDEELLCKESKNLRYEKPAVVGHVSLNKLLERLEEYREDEILVIVNDGALVQFVRGLSVTKNKDIQIIGRKTKRELGKFKNITVKDVHEDISEFKNWTTELQF